MNKQTTKKRSRSGGSSYWFSEKSFQVLHTGLHPPLWWTQKLKSRNCESHLSLWFGTRDLFQKWGKELVNLWISFFFFPDAFSNLYKRNHQRKWNGNGDLLNGMWERPVSLRNEDGDKGPGGLADQHRGPQREALTWSGSWRGRAGTGSHRQWALGPDLSKAPQVSSVCLSPSQPGAYETLFPLPHTADFWRMWVLSWSGTYIAWLHPHLCCKLGSSLVRQELLSSFYKRNGDPESRSDIYMIGQQVRDPVCLSHWNCLSSKLSGPPSRASRLIWVRG